MSTFEELITRNDVVSQRLGFGQWNSFIGVTNGHVLLSTRLKGRSEKSCDFIGCNTSNHVQVRLGDNVQVVIVRFCLHACRVNSIDCDKKDNAMILRASVKYSQLALP